MSHTKFKINIQSEKLTYSHDRFGSFCICGHKIFQLGLTLDLKDAGNHTRLTGQKWGGLAASLKVLKPKGEGSMGALLFFPGMFLLNRLQLFFLQNLPCPILSQMGHALRLHLAIPL